MRRCRHKEEKIFNIGKQVQCPQHIFHKIQTDVRWKKMKLELFPAVLTLNISFIHHLKSKERLNHILLQSK